jgi:hypothetical protein
MGIGAQGQQDTPVYYDNNTGQYYTQSTQINSNPFFSMLGLANKNANRNYLQNMNNQSMTAKELAPYNYIDIATLFPQLSQAAIGVPVNSLLGDAVQDTTTGEAKGAAKGAAQSASSGAGRFM